LFDFLTATLKHIPGETWREWIDANLLVGADRSVVTGRHRVRAGERYYHKHPGITEPDVSADIKFLYEDEAFIVLNKPAPLPVHAGGRFNRNTLRHFLNEVYYPQKPRPAHRLDANTTGLLLVTRTKHFASLLQPQFERGEVEKTYIARVHGRPGESRFSCDAPISDGPGKAGIRGIDYEAGLSARTDFTVLESWDDGTSLVEARPITGRTNQIRAHLWERGLPICGDPVYRPNGALGTTQTLGVLDAPLCLHAWKLAFKNPLTEERMRFTAPPPQWAQAPERVGLGQNSVRLAPDHMLTY
jgi:RluA family pseudouridine synthase